MAGTAGIELKVSGQLVFNNSYQTLKAALKGFDLACIPKAPAKPHVDAGQLEWVMADWFPTLTGHHACYPTRRQSSMAVRLVIAALRASRPG